MWKNKIIAFTLLIAACISCQRVSAQVYAENNPYVDDKLVHFGFYLGINWMAFGVQESGIELPALEREGGLDIYNARVSYLTPGFSVGFITDLKLTRHLNLRFIPGLHYGAKTIAYKNQSGVAIKDNEVTLLSIPIDIPLMLKWSAEREGNFRPYLIGGGGVSYDFGRSKDNVLLQKAFDYFVEFGFGCDIYFQWFKFCPELRYQLGFNNVLTPVTETDGTWNPSKEDYWYTNAISRLVNQRISLIFNFE